MKKIIALFSLVLFVSCKSAVLDTPTPPTDTSAVAATKPTGNLTVKTINPAARTIAPDIGEAAYFDIGGTGPLATDKFSKTNVVGNLSVNLVPGKWIITVDAKNSKGEFIGYGSSEVNVVVGQETTTSVTINPYTDGTGKFYLSINWEVGKVANPRLVATLDGVVLTTVISGNTAKVEVDLAVGYYKKLVIRLYDGDKEVGVYGPEVVRIVKGFTTEGVISFNVNTPTLTTGSVPMILVVDLQNPQVITFSNDNYQTDFGYDTIISATISPEPIQKQWFLDGEEIVGQNTSTLYIGKNLSIGKHNVVLISNSNGIYGSKSTDIIIKDPYSFGNSFVPYTKEIVYEDVSQPEYGYQGRVIEFYHFTLAEEVITKGFTISFDVDYDQSYNLGYGYKNSEKDFYIDNEVPFNVNIYINKNGTKIRTFREENLQNRTNCSVKIFSEDVITGIKNPKATYFDSKFNQEENIPCRVYNDEYVTIFYKLKDRPMNHGNSNGYFLISFESDSGTYYSLLEKVDELKCVTLSMGAKALVFQKQKLLSVTSIEGVQGLYDSVPAYGSRIAPFTKPYFMDSVYISGVTSSNSGINVSQAHKNGYDNFNYILVGQKPLFFFEYGAQAMSGSHYASISLDNGYTGGITVPNTSYWGYIPTVWMATEIDPLPVYDFKVSYDVSMGDYYAFLTSAFIAEPKIIYLK